MRCRRHSQGSEGEACVVEQQRTLVKLKVFGLLVDIVVEFWQRVIVQLEVFIGIQWWIYLEQRGRREQ